MELNLKQIAEIIEGELVGDGNTVIKGVSSLTEAKEDDLSFLIDRKYLKDLEKTKAGAVIVPQDVSLAGKNLIKAKNPYLGFTKILKLLEKEKRVHFSGIHPSAVLGEKVKLGKDVALGAFSVISDEVELAEGVIIYPHCFLGRGTKVGENTLIYSKVTIQEKTLIGKNVIIHSGAVIGSDGFGFLRDKEKPEKIPQLGSVEIGDEVEIGANTTIDRATLGKTKIGSGTKIDNLVQIGHNVEIGENCLIAAHVGIAGSTKIGNQVIIAGQSGVSDHLTIGDKTIIAARSGAIRNLPPGITVSGFPAREHRQMLKIQALMDKLPEIYKLFRKLSKK